MKMIHQLWLKLEDWRLRQHFRRVLWILRRRNTSHLPAHLQARREAQLKRLQAYAERSIFPRNQSNKIYTPCFIDRDGRECAVAHLAIEAGQAALVQKILSSANYAYVPQMQFPELAIWAEDTGLSSEELSLIQPGYWLGLDEILPFVLTAWLTASSNILFQTIQILRKHKGIATFIIGIGLNLVVCFFSVVPFFETMAASSLSRGPVDVSDAIVRGAAEDLPALQMASLLTLFLLCLSWALSLYKRPALSWKKAKKRRKARDRG